jgi:hypothetical protein
MKLNGLGWKLENVVLEKVGRDAESESGLLHKEEQNAFFVHFQCREM